MRLRTLSNPRQTLVLLEGCLATSQPALPAAAVRVGDAAELPAPLRHRAESQAGGDGVWLAWTDQQRVWFFTGEPAPALSRERKQPVLGVREYDERGELIEAANWVLTPLAGWKRLAT